jgi:hypothetical protein
VLQALAVSVETVVMVVMADWVAVSKLHAQQKLVMVALVEPVGLAEQAEKEAMVPMELAKPYTLFLGIHF